MSTQRGKVMARRRLLKAASEFEQTRESNEAKIGTLWKHDQLRGAEEALEEAALAYAKSLGWQPRVLQ